MLAITVTIIVPSVFAATSGHAAPPASATLSWTSRIGDTFGPGDGKLRTYSFGGYDFNVSAQPVGGEFSTSAGTAASAGPGNIGIIVASKDPAKFPNPDIFLGFTVGKGQAVVPGTYTVTSSTGTHSSTVLTSAASVHFTPALGKCKTEDTVGTFKIIRSAFEIVPITGKEKTFAFHPLALQMHFEIRCSAADGVFAGDFTMTDKSFPDGIAWDPSTVSGGTGDGTGDGSGGTPQPTPPGPLVVLPDAVVATPTVMANSASTTVPFTTFIPTTVTGDVTLTAATDADNLLATVSPSVIPFGGSGDAVLTIRTTPTTAAGDHTVTITASDGITSSSATVFVTVICDPPFILGIDQPKTSTVSLGRPALLSVKASGSGPFTYQWFTGSTGLVNFPLAGGTTANFTTSAINDTTQYWVRVTNPCGSADSQTATIKVSAGATPTRR